MLPDTAKQHYSSQQQLARQTLKSARSLWRRIGVEFDAGWAAHGAAMAAVVQNAMQETAVAGAEYVPAVMAETGQDISGIAAIAPAAFARTSRSGATVPDVLHLSIVRAKQAVSAGMDAFGALKQGAEYLDVAVPTLLADANRDAVQATVITSKATGYVRMLNTPSCKRCITLAGKWFRWNVGFQRHPKCDCRHIPAAENRAGDFTTDPYAAFRSMTEAEQDAVFGKANAQAIRDGADIYKVVNLDDPQRFARWDAEGRMTLDGIYDVAGDDKAKARELLKEQGYIVGPQEIRQQRERFAEPSKRPIVPGSARDRILQARATGERDPLDRATMTAAEQRLFDATYRLEYAKRTGYAPRSIGFNSADVFGRAQGMKVNAETMADLEQWVNSQLAVIDTSRPEGQQLYGLAETLGLLDGRADIIHERIYDQMRLNYANAHQLTLEQALRLI